MKKKKLRIRDAVRKPCLGPGCEQLAIRPCLYCGEECIVRYGTCRIHVHVHVFLAYISGLHLEEISRGAKHEH